MPTIHFETITNIRKDAGLFRAVESTSGGGRKTITGEVNGTNVDFYVPDVPIVDENNDDVVDKADVKAYVDGVQATIAEINAESGKITLETAPPENAVLVIRYVTSPATDSYITKMRDNVENWLVGYAKKYYDTTKALAGGLFPDEWANITRIRTAGYIQIQEWGTNVDTDGTSKDGYKKLEQSKSDLDDWIDSIKGSDDPDVKNPNSGSVRVSDRNVFSRDGFRGRRPDGNSDEHFHNRMRG